MTQMDHVPALIEAFDIDGLGLENVLAQRVKDRLQQRFRKIPQMYLAPLVEVLANPELMVATNSEVDIDPWTGWVKCIAEELPPQQGTDIHCSSCGAGINEGCRTASGNPTRYHTLRAQMNGRRNYDIERSAWFQRARAGEVDFCKCPLCYGVIQQLAEQAGITCEEQEQIFRDNP